MIAADALKVFLNTALLNKKERYLGFISKSKNRNKFLDTIYHELEGDLDSSYKSKSLPANAWELPGLLFEPPNTFGEPILSLKDADSNLTDAFLVISVDGKYAIHGPETFIDSRAYYSG